MTLVVSVLLNQYLVGTKVAELSSNNRGCIVGTVVITVAGYEGGNKAIAIGIVTSGKLNVKGVVHRGECSQRLGTVYLTDNEG